MTNLYCCCYTSKNCLSLSTQVTDLSLLLFVIPQVIVCSSTLLTLMWRSQMVVTRTMWRCTRWMLQVPSSSTTVPPPAAPPFHPLSLSTTLCGWSSAQMVCQQVAEASWLPTVLVSSDWTPESIALSIFIFFKLLEYYDAWDTLLNNYNDNFEINSNAHMGIDNFITIKTCTDTSFSL